MTDAEAIKKCWEILEKQFADRNSLELAKAKDHIDKIIKEFQNK